MELGDETERFLERFYSELSDLAFLRGGSVVEYLGDSMYSVYEGAAEAAAVDAALAMRAQYRVVLTERGIGTESEPENGISSGLVALRVVGHPSNRVQRIYGEAVQEATALGCHRGIAVTAVVRDRLGPSTRLVRYLLFW